MQKINDISRYLENISLLMVAVLFVSFPIAFSTLMTDAFTLPKQFILGFVTLFTLLLWGARMISDGQVRIRRSPLDIPIFLFAIVLLASALFSVNRADALMAYVPTLFGIFLYFIIVQVAKTRSALMFLLGALIIGGILLAGINMLSFFKIYLLPFAFAKTQTFTTTGSLLDHLLYLVFLLPIAIFCSWELIKRYTKESMSSTSARHSRTSATQGIFAFASIILTVGVALAVYQLVVLQKPFILPFETGFQTAFAAISQDNGRTAQGFFLGSGYGTYTTDFTRFKSPVFNLNENLWSLTFFRSSSFLLELLATTGVLGLAAFLFIIIQLLRTTSVRDLKKNPMFTAIFIIVLGSLLLPYTFTIQTLLFILLGLFVAAEGVRNHPKFYEIELSFVALRKGFINASLPYPFAEGPAPRSHDKTFSKIMPVSFFLLFLAISGVLGYHMIRFASSDIAFQRSLLAAAENNGIQTYNEQTNAIKTFPYRDSYYRIYSQVNLNLANSIASSQPKDSTPSAEIQQTIYTLIQQSINSARSATALAPYSSTNWQNLSSIYRSLIGFGQNAEQFAVIANQQAIALDPNNPQLYINQGGIFYQLGLWDEAQRNFQIATNLKPDYANAYYNLGHALEQKGDLATALVQYETVKTLVTNDEQNTKLITTKIQQLKEKQQTVLGEQAQAQAEEAARNVQPSQQAQQPLNVNRPAQQLPERDPQVQIPAPSPRVPASPSPSVTPGQGQTNPTPAGAVTPTTQP